MLKIKPSKKSEEKEILTDTKKEIIKEHKHNRFILYRGTLICTKCKQEIKSTNEIKLLIKQLRKAQDDRKQ